jgi:NAD(P)-dependent dehydrogenase (short-subunit alcohol dehydrogenase family)
MTTKWTAENIPDLTGKTAVVTGANSGIGYETARALAGKRAAVILACRNPEKGQAAQRRITLENPDAKAECALLDLTDLASIRRFAGEFNHRRKKLDLLINNAGIMRTPPGRTADGFELQFGVNHLGHFALTGLLLDLIVHTPGARVVTVSSGGHRFGKIDFDNLDARKGYDPGAAYGQSKLANLLFAYELDRRFRAAGVDAVSAAAHPGWTAGTNLAVHWWMIRFLNPILGQPPAMGALPVLYTAVAPEAAEGGYYGPGGWLELGGYPAKLRSSDRSYDPATAAKLWAVSEEMTGVRYPEIGKSTPTAAAGRPGFARGE